MLACIHNETYSQIDNLFVNNKSYATVFDTVIMTSVFPNLKS
jgi:hypothetical protein